MLIYNGVDVRTVSARLGHSQTSTTMNIYAEAIQSAEAAVADVLDDVFVRKAMPFWATYALGIWRYGGYRLLLSLTFPAAFAMINPYGKWILLKERST